MFRNTHVNNIKFKYFVNNSIYLIFYLKNLRNTLIYIISCLKSTNVKLYNYYFTIVFFERDFLNTINIIIAIIPIKLNIIYLITLVSWLLSIINSPLELVTLKLR